jgi:signal peptidase I
MEPTVKAGQVITVRAVGHEYSPRRGDIVLFHPDGGQWGDKKGPFLKRVVAVGGETIACCDSAGKVTLNGTPLAEPYVANDARLDMPPSRQDCGPRRFGPVAVAVGTVFVMETTPRRRLTPGVSGRYRRRRCSPSWSADRSRASAASVLGPVLPERAPLPLPHITGGASDWRQTPLINARLARRGGNRCSGTLKSREPGLHDASRSG